MESNAKKKTGYLVFYLLAFISLGATTFGSVILTEAGQMMNLPRPWLIEFFRYRVPISIGIGIALALIVIVQFRYRVATRKIFIMILVGNAVGLFVINSFVPDYWLRSQHYIAEYTSIEEADRLLGEDDDVFVLEINGDARAFPRDWMMLPHFAGGEIGGEHVAMSYCVLSNLPLAFSSQFDGQPTEYKVIAQAHNNLIFTDRVSGELIQQITGTALLSNRKLEQYPAQRMPWHAFKSLYPEGKVLHYIEKNLLDKITDKMFTKELIKHYAGKPIFPTLDLKDNRLPSEELVWGLDINGKQIAVALSAFKDERVIPVELGDQHFLLAWFPEYETLGAFRAQGEGIQQDLKIDPYGNTTSGKLERVHMYSGLLWMVWSHWYSDTKVLK
ncbi:DUF3179 domain-containing (seleno)protein [Thermodesulfobacteriota bacterium]